jgi:hypothetical protein
MTNSKFVAAAVPIVLLIFLSKSCSTPDAKKDVGAQQPVSYTIVDDYMGTKIKIGVPSSVNEHQLRAAMQKAADDHQDDAARDYLVSIYQWVDAYLVTDNQMSTVPAGTLRRYVPGGNPAERRRLTIDRTKDDTFTITLDQARNTLH